MRRNSQLFLFGFLVVAVGSACCLPILWPQLTGKNKEYDAGGLTFIVSLLVVGNLGLLTATLWARRKEAAAESEPREPSRNLGAETGEPDAFVRLDFRRTFPHLFWVSTVSYDSESPDGFRYRVFAIRWEPEMVVDLILLRETIDGPKLQVFHMQAPIDKLSAVNDVIREIERDKNVAFEHFNLADVRTFDEFKLIFPHLGAGSRGSRNRRNSLPGAALTGVPQAPAVGFS